MREPTPGRPLCPLFIDLTGRRCVVVGAGRIAERRVSTLLGGNASVHVIAPEVTEAISRLADDGSITLERRVYRRGDLEGAFLAVAATGSAQVDAEVASECAASGCLLNAVGSAGAGDTVMPAQVRRGDVRVAVSTAGGSPAVAASVRRVIEDALGEEWGPLLEAITKARDAALRSGDTEAKRAVDAIAGQADLRAALARRAHDEGDELLGWITAHGAGGSAGPFVSLVGAGPGDPGLITVKGLARLRSADVVVQDHLADPSLADEAPAHAERIYVGKRGGHDYLRQERINELIVEKALENGGQRVVRLKGGDPFVFGRGGEEALALVEAGIEFEVISGVSSGHSVPAAAGIPVTHRGLAASVAFVTGHEDPTKGRSDVDWPRLAQAAETICVFMGVRNAARIAEGLQAGGRSADEPAAVIRWGSTPRQLTHVTSLGRLAADVERLGLEPPALLVIGEVVRVREMLGGDSAFA